MGNIPQRMLPQSVKKAANRQNVNKQIDVAGKAFPCRGRRPRRPTHLPPWDKGEAHLNKRLPVAIAP